MKLLSCSKRRAASGRCTGKSQLPLVDSGAPLRTQVESTAITAEIMVCNLREYLFRERKGTSEGTTAGIQKSEEEAEARILGPGTRRNKRSPTEKRHGNNVPTPEKPRKHGIQESAAKRSLHSGKFKDFKKVSETRNETIVLIKDLWNDLKAKEAAENLDKS